jgi:hypothetical protein
LVVKYISPTSATENLVYIGSGNFQLSNTITRYRFKASFAIAQWTTNINLATDFTEYAWNTTLTAVSDTGGANNGYGTEGVAMQAFAPSIAATVVKRVVFRRPFGVTDFPVLEFKINGTWVPVENTPYGFQTNDAGTVYSGAYARPVVGGTAIDVNFCNTAFTGSTWAAETTLTHWRVRKVSNGNMAEQPPVVRAEYNNNAVNTTPDTQLNYQTKVEDTHSAVTIGSSWKFTAPIAGVYTIEANFVAVTAIGVVRLFKNGSVYRPLASSIIGQYISVSATIRLLAGDYIDIRPQANGIQAVANAYITITRIGS